jgi:membrane protease YdiL (CAAX protease family)
METGSPVDTAPRTRAEPLPFHRLARNEEFRWWRPVSGALLAVGTAVLAVFLLTFAAFAAGSFTTLPRTAGGFGLGAAGDTAVTLVMIAALIPSVLFWTKATGRRPAGTVSSVAGRLRWRWLGTCLLVAVAAVVVMLIGMQVMMAATGGSVISGKVHFPGWTAFLATAAMLAVLVPLQAAGEEYLFRGLAIQTLGAFLRNPAIPIGVQALLFAAAHGWGTPWGFVALTVSGLVAGVLAVRTGGIESYIGFHVANNLIAFTLAAAAGQLADESTAADMPWQMTVVSVAVDIAYGLVVLALARRRNLAVTASPVPVTTVLADPWQPVPVPASSPDLA